MTQLCLIYLDILLFNVIAKIECASCHRIYMTSLMLLMSIEEEETRGGGHLRNILSKGKRYITRLQ